MGEKSGVVGKVVHYYWIIESAKKWIMECVNEHSVFSKSDFWGKLKSIRNRINKDFTGTGLKIPKSENRKNPCFWEEKLSFWERTLCFWEIYFSFLENVFLLFGKKKFLFFCNKKCECNFVTYEIFRNRTSHFWE